MKRILVVSKFLPVPADNGGKRRQLATIEALTSRFDVTLAAFSDDTSDVDRTRALGCRVLTETWPRPKAELPGALFRARSLTSARFYSRGLRQQIAERIEEFDAIVLEYVQLRALLPAKLGQPLIWATHNVESKLVESYGNSSAGVRRWVAKAEGRAVARLEASVIRDASAATVVSSEDLDRLGPVDIRVEISPNGWPERQPLSWPDEPGVAFVGTMGWAPNAEAASWFVRNVWPMVLSEHPTAVLYLIGREPTDEVRSLASGSVTVTGTVDDVEPWLAKTQLAIAPLLAGGGTRLKILEALMAGRPVVSTTVGAEGLTPLWGRGVVLADQPSEFATAVSSLLSDSNAAQKMAAIGRETVLASYGWDKALKPLVELIEQATSPAR